MKKSVKILLIVIIIVGILGSLAYWQRNNLLALSMAFRHSNEELTTQMQDSRQELIEATKEQANITVRDLTEEERQALRDQTISQEELIEQMIQPEVTEGTAPEAEAEQQPAVDPDRELLNKYIAELYVMQEEYTTWLEQANQAAIDEFNALPVEEQTTASKYNIGLKYLGMGKDKEAEADARVAAQEQKIKDLLIKLGESTELVDQIHSTYLNEKAMKKAYYMGLHS